MEIRFHGNRDGSTNDQCSLRHGQLIVEMHGISRARFTPPAVAHAYRHERSVPIRETHSECTVPRRSMDTDCAALLRETPRSWLKPARHLPGYETQAYGTRDWSGPQMILRVY